VAAKLAIQALIIARFIRSTPPHFRVIIWFEEKDADRASTIPEPLFG
jgi:hypothetical protein